MSLGISARVGRPEAQAYALFGLDAFTVGCNYGVALLKTRMRRKACNIFIKSNSSFCQVAEMAPPCTATPSFGCACHDPFPRFPSTAWKNHEKKIVICGVVYGFRPPGIASMFYSLLVGMSFMRCIYQCNIVTACCYFDSKQNALLNPCKFPIRLLVKQFSNISS